MSLSTLETSSPQPPPVSSTSVVLTGNPNCGKTTLFNALTGLRAKVGNYAGVTVERKEGRLKGSPGDRPITILDLPGTYSLSPRSLDEQISRDVLFGRLEEVPAPSLVVIVVDASNLERNLYYATQVIELGFPTILALNMIDVARENGRDIDSDQLSKALGVPVLPMVASTGEGLTELRRAIAEQTGRTRRVIPRTFCELPEPFGRELTLLAAGLEKDHQQRDTSAYAEALLMLSDDKVLELARGRYSAEVIANIQAARQRLEKSGLDWRSVPIESRYARITAIQQAVTSETEMLRETLSDKLDRVLTHKVWGFLIFLGIMAVIFQSIFTLAQYPMDLIDAAVNGLGNRVGKAMPPGELNSLLVNGVIAGVGAVIVFLPQICLLFLFIGLLEDTGYMARAAFLMDRLMSRVGLHGKSFIPMLSSFACAIPGIMATRTIESPKDRLVTILVAPLMSCSARLPVYTVLIAACIPDQRVIGFFKLSGLVMLSMYLLGIVVALLMAWLFKKTLLKGETPLLILELPPYKRPHVRTLLRHMWDRSKIFLRRAGTVILGIAIILWFLATYPKNPALGQQFEAQRKAVAEMPMAATGTPAEIDEARAAQLEAIDKAEAGEQLRYSFAGRMGQAIEPAIRPLGFDWKIGIGLVASFAAREVFVSTMSTVYNVGEFEESDESFRSLGDVLRVQKWSNGAQVYTPLVCISLMVFYVFALQCVSTVAVVRRETNSWKWPIFQWLYMGALAWILAFVTYQGGKLLGFG